MVFVVCGVWICVSVCCGVFVWRTVPDSSNSRLCRVGSMNLSSQPFLPSQFTDRRFGTTALGILVTCRLGVVCDLTLVSSGTVELSSSPDFNWA